jgi:hypothetical protein
MEWNSQLVALVPEKWLDIWAQNPWSNAAWDVRELLDICTCTVPVPLRRFLRSRAWLRSEILGGFFRDSVRGSCFCEPTTSYQKFNKTNEMEAVVRIKRCTRKNVVTPAKSRYPFIETK